MEEGRRPKIMNKVWGIIGISLLMTGCASFYGIEKEQNLSKVTAGMKQSKVLFYLGTPDSVAQTSPSEDQWFYRFKTSEKKGQSMVFRFENGALVDFGSQDGREPASAVENRVSGNCTKRVLPDVQLQPLCLR